MPRAGARLRVELAEAHGAFRLRFADLGGVALAFWAVAAPAGARDPGSVVLIIADDLGAADLGCTGSPVSHTPHLDALARESVEYREAFHPSPSDGPGRSTLFTGLLAHASGQLGPAETSRFAVHRRVQSAFQMWKAGGVPTALLGSARVAPADLFTADFELDVDAHDVLYLAELARVFVESVEESRFLLVVAYEDPHGFGPRRRYEGVRARTFRADDLDVPWYLPDSPEIRREHANYLEAVSRLDQGVGALRRAIAGRHDVLLLFTSDGGAPFPGAGANLYDEGIRVPLLAQIPGQQPVIRSGLVSTVDLLPTMLDWAGVPGPRGYYLPGVSLVQRLEGKLVAMESLPARTSIIGTQTVLDDGTLYPMRMVRTWRYKYIRNLAPGTPFPVQSPAGTLPARVRGRAAEDYLHREEEELYDLKSDPRELENLAGNPEHAELQERMASLLDRLLAGSGDPWPDLPEN